KVGSQAATGGGRRMHAAFVAVQVGLSVILLTGAGLTLRGFLGLTDKPLGARSDGITILTLPIDDHLADETRRLQAVDRFIERLRALPGVDGVGAGHGLPMGGGHQAHFWLEGQPPAVPGAAPWAHLDAVT